MECYETCGDFCTAWRGFYNEQPVSCDNNEWCWQEYKGGKIETYANCQSALSPVHCIIDWMAGGHMCECVNVITYVTHDKQKYVLMLNTEKLIKNARK